MLEDARGAAGVAPVPDDTPVRDDVPVPDEAAPKGPSQCDSPESSGIV